MLEKLRLRHIIEILASVTLATLLALVPFGVYVNTPFEIAPAEAAPVAVLFVFVLGFLINNALFKGQQFKRHLNLELSRMRRLFHLTKNIGTTKLDKDYHNTIKKSVYAYFDFLNNYGLSAYSGGNKLFRKVSYGVYGYKPKNAKQEIMYKELLETSREVAATRQEINAILHSGITSYGWTVLGVMEVFVVVATLLAQGTDVKDFIVTSAMLSTIFIVTLLVWEVDHYSPPQLRDLGKRYGKSKRSLEKVDKSSIEGSASGGK
jgi:hypothetical protein